MTYTFTDPDDVSSDQNVGDQPTEAYPVPDLMPLTPLGPGRRSAASDKYEVAITRFGELLAYIKHLETEAAEQAPQHAAKLADKDTEIARRGDRSRNVSDDTQLTVRLPVDRHKKAEPANSGAILTLLCVIYHDITLY